MALVVIVGALLPACTPAPPPDTMPVQAEVRKESLRWASALIVTRDAEWKPRFKWSEGAMTIPKDAEGGSAAPVTADGYFLTASHVIGEQSEQVIHLLYGPHSSWRKARVVWRHARADLALLHVPLETPGFYTWRSSREWLPIGTRVFHTGMATGLSTAPGEVLTGLAPEAFWTGHRLFKIDLPLQPGDSGGAVLDAQGRLVGINSAVEYLVPMETAFFIDSEASRPNLSKLREIIRLDRQQLRGDQ